MSDTKTPLPPLVSDDAIAKVMADQFKTTRDHVVACGASRSVRNIYEADRQRTREAVQACVDALANPHKMSLAASALSLAKTINIEPAKP